MRIFKQSGEGQLSENVVGRRFYEKDSDEEDGEVGIFSPPVIIVICVRTMLWQQIYLKFSKPGPGLALTEKLFSSSACGMSYLMKVAEASFQLTRS